MTTTSLFSTGIQGPTPSRICPGVSGAATKLIEVGRRRENGAFDASVAAGKARAAAIPSHRGVAVSRTNGLCTRRGECVWLRECIPSFAQGGERGSRRLGQRAGIHPEQAPPDNVRRVKAQEAFAVMMREQIAPALRSLGLKG